MVVQYQDATFSWRLEALLDQHLAKLIVERDNVEFDLPRGVLLGCLVIVQRHVEELGVALLHLPANALDRWIGLEVGVDGVALGDEDVVGFIVGGTPM